MTLKTAQRLLHVGGGSGPPYSDVLLATSGLAGYWPMNDTNAVLLDASPGGHNGTLTQCNVGQPGPQNGITSVRFNPAQASFGSIPTTGLPNTANSPFAYEIWAKVIANGSPSGYGPFVNRGGNVSGLQLYLLTDPNDILWRWDAFNTGYVISEVGATWHQIVYGWTPGSPGTETIWVDGGGTGKKFTHAASFSGAFPGTVWSLGSNGGHDYNGYLCRFSMHTRIPTDAEVLARWNAGR